MDSIYRRCRIANGFLERDQRLRAELQSTTSDRAKIRLYGAGYKLLFQAIAHYQSCSVCRHGDAELAVAA